jgi:hypothetical protein
MQSQSKSWESSLMFQHFRNRVLWITAFVGRIRTPCLVYFLYIHTDEFVCGTYGGMRHAASGIHLTSLAPSSCTFQGVCNNTPLATPLQSAQDLVGTA